MYINFTYLHKKDISPLEYLLLLAIQQKDSEAILRMGYGSEAALFGLSKLFEQELVKEIKGAKKQPPEEKVRITSKGKELITRVSVFEYTEDVENLCENLCELFESYGKEAGNKRAVIENLTWFLSRANFTSEQIEESVEEWLANDWNMWLENILWDKKKASVYTTIASRDLRQSPLYEFMRRKYNLAL